MKKLTLKQVQSKILRQRRFNGLLLDEKIIISQRIFGENVADKFFAKVKGIRSSEILAGELARSLKLKTKFGSGDLHNFGSFIYKKEEYEELREEIVEYNAALKQKKRVKHNTERFVKAQRALTIKRQNYLERIAGKEKELLAKLKL